MYVIVMEHVQTENLNKQRELITLNQLTSHAGSTYHPLSQKGLQSRCENQEITEEKHPYDLSFLSKTFISGFFSPYCRTYSHSIIVLLLTAHVHLLMTF